MKNGLNEIFNSSRELIKSAEYKNDLINGSVKTYEHGKLINQKKYSNGEEVIIIPRITKEKTIKKIGDKKQYTDSLKTVKKDKTELSEKNDTIPTVIKKKKNISTKEQRLIVYTNSNILDELRIDHDFSKLRFRQIGTLKPQVQTS